MTIENAEKEKAKKLKEQKNKIKGEEDEDELTKPSRIKRSKIM